jgi:hypothetical protein
MGVTTTIADKNSIEADKVIRQNLNLFNIKKWAVLDTNSIVATTNKEIYLAQVTANLAKLSIERLTTIKETLQDKGLQDVMDYSINFKVNGNTITSTIPVGKYKAEIDMNLCTGATRTIDVNLKSVSIPQATDAKNNIILQKDLASRADDTGLTGTTSAMLVSGDSNNTVIYSRVPVKLVVDLGANEKALNYKLSTDVGTDITSLIRWYDLGTTKADTKVAGGFSYAVAASPNSKEIKGIFYYPTGAVQTALIFTQNTFGGSVIGSVVGGALGTINPSTSVIIPNTPTSAPAVLELDKTDVKTLDLTNVINSIKEGNACITTNGQTVIWNETQLLK